MDSGWVTVEEAARWDRISVSQAKRRVRGECKPDYISRLEPDSSGRMRRMVWGGSLSLAGQQRRSEPQIAALIGSGQSDFIRIGSGIGPQQSGMGSSADGQMGKPPDGQSEALRSAQDDKKTASVPGQRSMFPQTEEDKVIEAVKLKLRPSQVPDTLARYRALKPLLPDIQPAMNHDFAALGLGGKVEYSKRIAAQFNMSLRHFQRLRQKYCETLKGKGPEAAMESLALNSPGPEKWTGSPLDPRTPEGQSNIAFIQERWEIRRLTRRQTYNELAKYLEAKQRGTGPGWIYTVPTEQAVYTFINRRPPDGLNGDDNPRRMGEGAIKVAAGYIDRTYDDELAGDSWCTDEWEVDVYAADRKLPRQVYNYGKHGPVLHILSYIDERTTCILDWMLTTQIDADTPLLAERMVRKYWLPKMLIADRAGRFRHLVRAHKITGSSGELVEKISGPLGDLGVKPRSSEDKNPRGNRIERNTHGLFSTRAQRDFGGSWRPPEESGMRAAIGIDARVQAYLRRKHENDPVDLLYLDQVEQIVAKWIAEINDAPTEAKGCAAMTRREAFEYFQPKPEEIARRRATPEMIDLAFAERTNHLVIRPGGIVQWRDGLRYSSDALISHPGEIVPMLRYWRDTSQILVDLDGELVTASLRATVGRNMPELLSEESEKQAAIRKAIREGRLAAPRSSDEWQVTSDESALNRPSAIDNHQFQPEGTHGTKVLNNDSPDPTPRPVTTGANSPTAANPPADFQVESQESKVESSCSQLSTLDCRPPDHPSIGSVEYLMDRDRPIPSLHELEEFDPTMEEM